MAAHFLDLVKIVPELILDEYKPLAVGTSSSCAAMSWTPMVGCTCQQAAEAWYKNETGTYPQEDPQTLKSKRPQYNWKKANAVLAPRNLKHSLYIKARTISQSR